MKKTAAILLMLLLVFNITGYRLTVQWMQHKQNAGLEKQLDAAAYDETTLIELSIPLSLPYYNNWQHFERCNGEIIIDGVTHTYVMRKVQDGKLIIKCLPNPQQQTIQAAVSNLFAQMNGLPQNESSATGLKKTMNTRLFEYEEVTRPEFVCITFTQTLDYFPYLVKMLLHQTQSTPWQPPEVKR